VCVPLGPGNTAVTRRWQLVNLAGEDHHFHLHQTRLRILTDARLDRTSGAGRRMGDGVLLDNVRLLHAGAACNSVQRWRDGAGTAHPAVVQIVFAIAGDPRRSLMIGRSRWIPPEVQARTAGGASGGDLAQTPCRSRFRFGGGGQAITSMERHRAPSWLVPACRREQMVACRVAEAVAQFRIVDCPRHHHRTHAHGDHGEGALAGRGFGQVG